MVKFVANRSRGGRGRGAAAAGRGRGGASAGARGVRTGGVADARNKIVNKQRAGMVDARDKLVKMAKTGGDARQKLDKIRNLKQGKVRLRVRKMRRLLDLCLTYRIVIVPFCFSLR